MTAERQQRETAARMDAIYRHQRHVYDATRAFFLFGRNRLIAGLAPARGARVLEIGCGTGRNLIRAARAYPDCRFYGLDVSRQMLATARAAVAHAHLSERIVLAEGDATSFDAAALFGATAFERVFVSYALSMIPDWRSALQSAYAATAPGGELHIVDFGQQAGWPGIVKSPLRAWLGVFTVRPVDGLQAALDDLARTNSGTAHHARLYRDYAAYAVLKRVGK